MRPLPPGFRSDIVSVGELSMHIVHNGTPYEGQPFDDPRQPLLCLHGFPEFSVGWDAVAAELADEFLVVVPDQRGCGLSDAPLGAGHYTAKHLVNDAVQLSGQLFGDRPINIAGHDFGASVAYALALSHAHIVDRLIVINGVHPVCFQEALIDSPNQAAASQYFHTLRAPGAGVSAAANGFAAMFDTVEALSEAATWLTPTLRDVYRHGWEDADRLEAMFNWYRASPIVVPMPGAPLPPAGLYGAPRDKFRVEMPHTLIWGSNDSALLPESRAHLAEFCDTLTVHEVAGADHWILHTHPRVVSALIVEAMAR